MIVKTEQVQRESIINPQLPENCGHVWFGRLECSLRKDRQRAARAVLYHGPRPSLPIPHWQLAPMARPSHSNIRAPYTPLAISLETLSL